MSQEAAGDRPLGPALDLDRALDGLVAAGICYGASNNLIYEKVNKAEIEKCKAKVLAIVAGAPPPKGSEAAPNPERKES